MLMTLHTRWILLISWHFKTTGVLSRVTFVANPVLLTMGSVGVINSHFMFPIPLVTLGHVESCYRLIMRRNLISHPRHVPPPSNAPGLTQH